MTFEAARPETIGNADGRMKGADGGLRDYARAALRDVSRGRLDPRFRPTRGRDERKPRAMTRGAGAPRGERNEPRRATIGAESRMRPSDGRRNLLPTARRDPADTRTS